MRTVPRRVQRKALLLFTGTLALLFAALVGISRLL